MKRIFYLVIGLLSIITGSLLLWALWKGFSSGDIPRALIVGFLVFVIFAFGLSWLHVGFGIFTREELDEGLGNQDEDQE